LQARLPPDSLYTPRPEPRSRCSNVRRAVPRLDPARCQLTGDITMLPSLDADEVAHSFASAEALQHTRRQGYVHGHSAAVPTAWSRPSSARTASTSVTVLAAAAAAARTHASAAAGLARREHVSAQLIIF